MDMPPSLYIEVDRCAIRPELIQLTYISVADFFPINFTEKYTEKRKTWFKNLLEKTSHILYFRMRVPLIERKINFLNWEGRVGAINILKIGNKQTKKWHPVCCHHLQLISNGFLNWWLVFSEQQCHEILEAGGKWEHLLKANIYQ